MVTFRKSSRKSRLKHLDLPSPWGAQGSTRTLYEPAEAEAPQLTELSAPDGDDFPRGPVGDAPAHTCSRVCALARVGLCVCSGV